MRISAVQEDVEQSVTDWTELSASNPFVRVGILYLQQKLLLLCGCVAQTLTTCLEHQGMIAKKARF